MQEHQPSFFAETIVAARIRYAINDFEMLKNKGICFSPFLEIAAGVCHRSLALMNNYNSKLKGVSIDIDVESLSKMYDIQSIYNYDRTPFLICCDAFHLPFLPNTFNFIFIYQSLYQFENPIPIVEECYRVLGKNGCLFINEEPMDSSFRQFLRGNRHLYNPPRGILQKLAYKLRIENIFWDVRSKDKAEGKKFAHFNIELWRLVTAPFSYRDIEVNSRLRVHSNLYKPRFNVIISKIVGGNVRGILTKRDGDYAQNEFRDRLMCIECFSTSLIRNAYSLKCSSCDREYPITHNGIIRILPKYLEQELYGHLE